MLLLEAQPCNAEGGDLCGPVAVKKDVGHFEVPAKLEERVKEREKRPIQKPLTHLVLRTMQMLATSAVPSASSTMFKGLSKG